MHDDGCGFMPWRWKRLLALAGASLLGLAGCGGGSDGPGHDAGKGGAAPPASSNPAVSYYRVTPVGPEGGVTSQAWLNAAGQVAGTYSLPGEAGFFFFDGSRTTRVRTTSSGSPPLLSGFSDTGQVIGSLDASGTGEGGAFSWTPAGGLVRGLAQTPDRSEARDLNDAGQVVGFRTLEGNVGQGFLWSREAGLVTRFGDTRLSTALQINDTGLIAGQVLREGELQPVLVEAATGATSVLNRPVREDYAGLDITHLNDAGDVAGVLWPGELFASAFVANPRRDPDPVNLGTVLPPDYSSEAVALDERGTVLVRAEYRALGESARFLAFLADRRAEPTWVRPLQGQVFIARDLNRHGLVVGQGERQTSRADVDAVTAVAWTRESGAVDLDTRLLDAPPDLVLSGALAVADDGSILAAGAGQFYLLTPASPPASAAPAVVTRVDIPAVVRAGEPATFAVEFTDAAADTHTATWIWNSFETEAGTVTESGGQGRVTRTETFSGPTIRLVTLRITDSTGLRTEVTRAVMVRGEASGVWGEGSFASPARANRLDLGASGPADFRFKANYGKLDQAFVEFRTGGLDFRSDAVDLLLLFDDRAEIRGTGRLGGQGGYRFLLDALDGDTGSEVSRDGVRMRIWRYDETLGVDVLVYDNQRDPENLLQGLVLLDGEVDIYR